MTTTENNVAAQAGDEPMRLVSANLLDRAVAFLQSSGQMGVAHQLKECVSPRASADVERDAARYRWLLNNYARGDGYTDIDAALNEGEPEKYLSPAIDAAIATTKPGA